MQLYVAAVYAADGIRFLAAAPSAPGMAERLGEYVGRNAALLLWPADADRVRSLLAAGRVQEAVQHYFARVGERWEREYLRTEVVDVGEAAGGC